MIGSLTVSSQTLIVILVLVLIAGCLLWIRSASRRRGRRSHPRKAARRGGSSRPAYQREPGAVVARRYGHERSPEWPMVAHAHLQQQPGCAACGYQGHGLQVHHVKPFHLYPELELDPRNLITLCEIKGRDHHLLLGHLDDWESYNVHVRSDVKRFHGESAKRIRANSSWQKEVMQRPLP